MRSTASVRLRDTTSVYRSNWVHLPTDLIADVEALKRELCIANGSYFSAIHAGRPAPATDPYFICYQERDDGFLVPRNFDYTPYLRSKTDAQEVVDPDLESIQNDQGLLAERGWAHRIRLRPDQIRPAQTLLQPGDKILTLACGKGKTVVSLYALCAAAPVRLPALVVVHTSDLMAQWERAVRRFMYLGLNRVGTIRAQVCDTKRAPITLATVQSLSSKAYPEYIYRHFKTVVFDEVHRLGAPYFSTVCPMFLGERWGLSATPKRRDGNDRVFRLHCGEVAYVDLDQPLSPRVSFVHTGFSVNMNRYRMWGNPHTVNTAKLYTDTSRNETRNELVLGYVRRALDKGRTILILGERVEQLKQLSAATGSRARPLVGSMPDADRVKALSYQAVFATAKLAKEAIDRPAFDTLMVLQPTTDPSWLQQAFGRILRPHDEKHEPVVVIFEDYMIPMMSRRCDSIRSWCLKQKYNCTVAR